MERQFWWGWKWSRVKDWMWTIYANQRIEDELDLKTLLSKQRQLLVISTPQLSTKAQAFPCILELDWGDDKNLARQVDPRNYKIISFNWFLPPNPKASGLIHYFKNRTILAGSIGWTENQTKPVQNRNNWWKIWLRFGKKKKKNRSISRFFDRSNSLTVLILYM